MSKNKTSAVMPCFFRNQTYNKPQIYRMWSNKPKKSFISSHQNG